MSRNKQLRSQASPKEEREQFIRENAVALVREREERIERQRRRIAQLEAMVRDLRRRKG